MGFHNIPAAVGAQLIVAETEVFSGNSPDPSAWTDLDLSGTIGAQSTLVILKVNPAVNQYMAVRKNGDTDEHYMETTNPFGAAFARGHSSAIHAIFVVVTDTSGVIEWKYSGAASPVTIDVIGYIK